MYLHFSRERADPGVLQGKPLAPDRLRRMQPRFHQNREQVSRAKS